MDVSDEHKSTPSPATSRKRARTEGMDLASILSIISGSANDFAPPALPAAKNSDSDAGLLARLRDLEVGTAQSHSEITHLQDQLQRSQVEVLNLESEVREMRQKIASCEEDKGVLKCMVGDLRAEFE